MMTRLRPIALVPVVAGIVAVAAGWVLAGALRLAPAEPVAPIEIPSGDPTQPLTLPQPGGARPAGPAPPRAGTVGEPVGTVPGEAPAGTPGRDGVSDPARAGDGDREEGGGARGSDGGEARSSDGDEG